MKKIKNLFLGDYLAKAEDVFEKGRIELVYNFSLFFFLIGLMFYGNIIANHLHYMFYLISVGVIGLAIMPFILKYKKNLNLAAWIWIIQQNIVGLGSTFVQEGNFDIAAGFWMMVQVLFCFFVFTKKSLLIAM